MGQVINSGRTKIAGAVAGSLTVDRFVFALIPGLDTSVDVDLDEAYPEPAEVVHVADVTAQGFVAADKVVYSCILGTDIGDFDFNWVGLQHTDDTLIAVAYTPTQTKYATAGFDIGNTVTRNFLTQYNSAMEVTGINVPVEAWQIDFLGRLESQDELRRQDMEKLYGAQTFINDGFLVYVDGTDVTVTAGAGYVGGLLATLAANTVFDPGALPKDIYIDAALVADANESAVVVTIESSTDAVPLTDYTDAAGDTHYLVKIATVAANLTVTDHRAKIPITSSLVAALLDRANHTGTQGMETINGLVEGFDDKPDFDELGSAAFSDVLSDPTDTAAGGVMRFGDHGSGRGIGQADFNLITAARDTNQFFSTAFNPANKPTGSNYFSGFVVSHNVAGDYETLVCGSASDAPLIVINKTAGEWQPPRILWDNINLVKTTSASSSAAGKMVKVFDYGLGVVTDGGSTPLSATNQLMIGMWRGTAGDSFNPGGASSASVLNLRPGVLGVAHQFFARQGNNELQSRRWDGTEWSPPVTYWNDSTFNPATKADLITDSGSFAMTGLGSGQWRATKVGEAVMVSISFTTSLSPTVTGTAAAAITAGVRGSGGGIAVSNTADDDGYQITINDSGSITLRINAGAGGQRNYKGTVVCDAA